MGRPNRALLAALALDAEATVAVPGTRLFWARIHFVAARACDAGTLTRLASQRVQV